MNFLDLIEKQILILLIQLVFFLSSSTRTRWSEDYHLLKLKDFL